LAFDGSEAGLARCRQLHLETIDRQVLRECLGNVFLILDDENPGPWFRESRVR
jgi:hypothetical protein